MHSSKDSYFIDKRVSVSMNNTRRMSSSGFEYPKEFSNFQTSRNYTTISEEKVQPTMINNIQQSINGAKKGEYVIPNFFSENNINISNQCNSSLRNMMSTSHSNASDARLKYNDPTSFSRFISTPIISNTSLEDSLHNNNFIDAKNFDHNNYSYDSPNLQSNSAVPPNDIHNQYNHKYPEYMFPNDQYYNNFANNSYMPSYMIYDPRSNSFQNVVLVPQVMPMMNPYMEVNEDNQYYFRGNNMRNMQNNPYQDYNNFSTSEGMNLNNQYQDLKNPDFVETNGFSHNSKDEYTYDEQAEICDELEDMYQIESESLHSLNRNISGDSEDYSSEDDQLNTVHGDEMLEELQKLSSVFTNVVNVSVMSRNSNVSEPVELLNNINSSRFKKTRIKERTTYWNNKQAIVKDNLVKIIPEEILKIPFIDNDRLNQFENDIFGDQLSNEDQKEKVTDQPDCVHSMLRNSSVFNEHRIHKHSNCTSQWYRSSATPISLNEFPHLSSNQLHKSNISTRYGNHRKSLQIPIPFPLLVNKFIPLLSPVIPHCNKAFYEQSNSNNMNNIRRKRRWSVSCSRLDTENSNVSNSNSVIQNNESPRDPAKDLLESHQSDESSDRDTKHFINSFESRIDHHLFCLKRSLKAQFDLSLRDIRSEIKSMRNTQIELESQLLFYKNKLDSMEKSIRKSVPETEWKSFGIGIDLES